jgi:eukaryotic-like serine/threonine-protein kinase
MSIACLISSAPVIADARSTGRVKLSSTPIPYKQTPLGRIDDETVELPPVNAAKRRVARPEVLRRACHPAAFVLLIGFGVLLAGHVVSALLNEPFHPFLLGVHALVVLVLGLILLPFRRTKARQRGAFEGKQLGQYRLITRLGAGGMGEVYLAKHRMLKRRCAIKLIKPDRAGDPQVLARFEREVRLTAQLSHWNTVEIFDFGRTEDGTFFYVMEYLPGLSLEDLLERHGPLAAERVVHLLRQICQGLREAHGVGLIHRDIKPGNLFVAQRGGLHDVAKLLDFGLVKPVAETSSARLTQEGAISGTPLFMSPEQALGRDDLDARSDIYSLGAVAYAMITGRPPFGGSNPLEVMIAHAHDNVAPPSQFRADVPADLERVVLRCLGKRPQDRFQNVESLEQALAECAAADQWTQSHAARWWQENDRTGGIRGNQVDSRIHDSEVVQY